MKQRVDAHAHTPASILFYACMHFCGLSWQAYLCRNSIRGIPAWSVCVCVCAMASAVASPPAMGVQWCVCVCMCTYMVLYHGTHEATPAVQSRE